MKVQALLLAGSLAVSVAVLAPPSAEAACWVWQSCDRNPTAPVGPSAPPPDEMPAASAEAPAKPAKAAKKPAAAPIEEARETPAEPPAPKPAPAKPAQAAAPVAPPPAPAKPAVPPAPAQANAVPPAPPAAPAPAKPVAPPAPVQANAAPAPIPATPPAPAKPAAPAPRRKLRQHRRCRHQRRRLHPQRRPRRQRRLRSQSQYLGWRRSSRLNRWRGASKAPRKSRSTARAKIQSAARSSCAMHAAPGTAPRLRRIRARGCVGHRKLSTGFCAGKCRSGTRNSRPVRFGFRARQAHTWRYIAKFQMVLWREREGASL